MTHDELLAKVETDQEITKFLTKSLMQGDIAINVARQHWFQSNALRAVVELHKPKDGKKFCKTCGKFFPCSTIQAIEKELQ